MPSALDQDKATIYAHDGGKWREDGVVMDSSVVSTKPCLAEPNIIYGEQGIILEGTVWKMWFRSGYGGDGLIWYAESFDGLKWTKYETPVATGYYCPSVVKIGSVYHLYASTDNWAQYDHLSCEDGISFVVVSTDILPMGGVGSWNYDVIGNTSAVVIDGTMYAFVEGRGTTWQIGLYTSTDFDTFTESEGNPIITNVGAVGGTTVPFLIGGTWYMWLHSSTTEDGGLPTDIYRVKASDIGGAWSFDPVGTVLVRLRADEGAGLATGQLADPSIVEVNGKTYLFVAVDVDGTLATDVHASIKRFTFDGTMAELVKTSEGRMKIMKCQF